MDEKAVRIPISRRDASTAAQKQTKRKNGDIIATRVPISVDLVEPPPPVAKAGFNARTIPITDTFFLEVTVSAGAEAIDVTLFSVRTHATSGSGLHELVTTDTFDLPFCVPQPDNNGDFTITIPGGQTTGRFTLKMDPAKREIADLESGAIHDLIFFVKADSTARRKKRWGLARFRKP